MSTVDFAIITAKQEEFQAVLERFPQQFDESFQRLRRHYTFRKVTTSGGRNYVLAIVRCIYQGLSEAQNLATDIIEDLRPQWILFVGIGGGVPSEDLFLGDVVLATQIHDFSLGADTPMGREHAVQGYNLPKNVGTLVASLCGRQSELGEWNHHKMIGYARPPIQGSEENYTGDAEWDDRIRKAIHFHSDRIFPKFVDGPIASSDDLLKDYNKLKERLQIDRRILSAEMEAAGVAKACNRHDGQVLFLPIRCISDIVGLRRDPGWTQYACKVAASFTSALINLGFLSNDNKPRTESLSPVESPGVEVQAKFQGIFEYLVAPFPLELFTKLFNARTDEVHRYLDHLIRDQVLSKDSETVFQGVKFNMSLAPSNKTPDEFIERALTVLLSFIDRRGRDLAGIRQCENAIALFKRLSAHTQRLFAPRFFDVLDRPMKALGNKQLVEQVATLCVVATDHSDRTKEEAECEARARICGLSWVYQRTGRLELAADEAEKSLEVSKNLNLLKNLAFCNKCLGRLSRMRGETSSNTEERDFHLTKSVECLNKAIDSFSNLAGYGNEDPEVGDCHSLLARTYLVAGDLTKAEQHAYEAIDRITDNVSKDYLDLQILLGELAESRGRLDKAIAHYTIVVDSRIDKADFQHSEIFARALYRRARCFSRNAVEKAIKDYRTAASIWAQYHENEPSAEAEWQAILLSEKFPSSVKKILEDAPATHRVEAVRRFEQKKAAKKAGTLSRRVGHDITVWKQLLKQVREDKALNREV